jgi:hypothetical protein
MPYGGLIPSLEVDLLLWAQHTQWRGHFSGKELTYELLGDNLWFPRGQIAKKLSPTSIHQI